MKLSFSQRLILTFVRRLDGANPGPNGAGVKYKAIIRELEQILTRPLEQLPKEDEFFDDLRKRLDDLKWRLRSCRMASIVKSKGAMTVSSSQIMSQHLSSE